MKHRIASQEEEYKKIDFMILKRLLLWLKPYKHLVIVAVIGVIITSALGPIRPYLTKVAIDDNIANKDWNGLLMISILILGLLLVHSILQFGILLLLQFIGQKTLNDIRKKVFSHIQSLSVRYFDKTPVGRLVTRVTNDVEALNELFSTGVVMVIADILLVVWIIGFMFYTNTNLALLTLIILPMLALVSYIFRVRIRKLFREIRLNIAAINTFLNEFITGISTIKSFSRSKHKESEFDKLNQKQKSLQIKMVFHYAVFFPVIELISSIGIGIILWYAAGNLLSGDMTIGMLIAFTQYAEMLFRPIRDLTEKYTTLQSAMASSERIFSLLDTDDKIIDEKDAVELVTFNNKIEFKDVSFSYDNEKLVLKNISFEINKGEKIAIVGATGSGKTTLINLLCRFYEHRLGEILIDGIDIRKIKVSSLRSKIALVMQDGFLFSRSIYSNISLDNAQINMNDSKKASELIGSDSFIQKRSGGYDELLSERGATLSTGERQLLSFTRAFAANREILILDEATSNMDNESEEKIAKSLEKLMESRTSLIIAHRLSTIREADRIIVLHHGEIVETGTHEDLMQNEGIYYKLNMLGNTKPYQNVS